MSVASSCGEPPVQAVDRVARSPRRAVRRTPSGSRGSYRSAGPRRTRSPSGESASVMPSVKQTSRSPAPISTRRSCTSSPARRRARGRSGRAARSRRRRARGRAGSARRWRTTIVVASRVDDRVAERHELAGRDVAAEQPVDAGADIVRFGGRGRERAHRGLQIRHQQRRRQPLADDVGDRDGDARVGEAKHVVAVAADAGRRRPQRRESQPFTSGIVDGSSAR